MEPRRANAIAELAEHIAVQRFGGERVSPEEIASSEGIAYRYESFDEEFDGILLYEAGRFLIVCNERRALRGSARSRFTFAHELGHYFIDEHRQALASGKMPLHFSLAEHVSDQPVETEADHFAANLLMPATPFRRKAADLDPGLQLISDLATTYGASFTSTAFRALQLDVFPAPSALFRWQKNGEQSGRRISPTTFSMFPGYRSMIASIPNGSLTEAVVAGRSLSGAKGISDCSQWLPNVRPEDRRNVSLNEEAMSIGHFGWLTLLYRNTQF